MNALLENKVDISHLVSEDLLAKLDNSLLSRGLTHEFKNPDIIFDREVNDFFDEKAKNALKIIYQSKYYIKY